MHARQASHASSSMEMPPPNNIYLKGHPYSNYHPLPDASTIHGKQQPALVDQRSADLLVAQSQTDLYEKTHIVSKPFKGTPQYTYKPSITLNY